MLSALEPTKFDHACAVRENYATDCARNSVLNQPIPVRKTASMLLFSKNNFWLRKINNLKCIFVNRKEN